MLTPGALAVPPLLNQSPVATGDTWLGLGFILYISFNYFRLKKKKKICQKPGAGLQSSLCGLWPFQGRHSAGFSGQSSAWLRGSAGSDPSGPFQPRLSVWLF